LRTPRREPPMRPRAPEPEVKPTSPGPDDRHRTGGDPTGRAPGKSP
jgi:hypothetical protein